MDPEKMILTILSGYEAANQRDILEAVAIRLGLVEIDEDEDGFNNPAPWAD